MQAGMMLYEKSCNRVKYKSNNREILFEYFTRFSYIISILKTTGEPYFLGMV